MGDYILVMGMMTATEFWPVVAVILLLIIPLAWFYLRRRWLSGAFDCALRTKVGQGAWQLGSARYQGEYLEWFRVFSLGVRPRFRMRRSTLHVLYSRDAVVTDDLYGSERVLEVEFGTGERHQHVEVAMDRDATTALLSWIEAAPPSIDRFPSS